MLTCKSLEFTVSATEGGRPLLDVLAVRLCLSRKKAKQLVDGRNVFVDGQRIWMARHRLEKGNVVTAPMTRSGADSPALRFPRLFDDAHYLIVNKPPRLLSNGPDSVESRLREELHSSALQAVHRLDRDTSGCLWLARHQEAFDKAVELFRSRHVTKTYHVIVAGRPSPPEQTLRMPLDGQSALTRIRTLDANESATHLLARLETGRTHQIRRHLAAIRHPVLGDSQYGPPPGSRRTERRERERKLPERPVGRHMLHAASLVFRHPYGGAPVCVKAPLPSDFRGCLRSLGLT